MINAQNIFFILLIVNALSFALFSYDKKAAVFRYYRIKNKMLIFIGFAGPLGALLSIKALRHKTKKFKKYIKKYFFIGSIEILLLILLSLINYWF